MFVGFSNVGNRQQTSAAIENLGWNGIFFKKTFSERWVRGRILG